MRDLIFKFGTVLIAIRIENSKSLKFCKVQGGYFKYTTIEGLQLEPAGILKEFPDLKDKSEKEMKRIAILRFKLHIGKMKTEQEIQNYLQKDLKKHGYELKYFRRAGFRRCRVK